MAYKKSLTLPSQIKLEYFVISQIDLPVWHRGDSWTSGRVVFDRYLSQEAYKSGAKRFDSVIFTLNGAAFTQLNFITQDGLLQGMYPLLQNFISEFADAEIVDVTSNENGVDGGVI